MNNYEIMYIIKTSVEEDKVKEINALLQNAITTNEGTIVNFNELGQKELAYEIEKCNTGYYFLINLQSENDKAIKEFERLALINENVIRHLIINTDEK